MAEKKPGVFINCAFDAAFKPIFEAIVFAVMRSGFSARCALEADDASENRFAKIQRIIGDCVYGIHDISRTETDGEPPLPRFNMPLELGLFLGAKRYGGPVQRTKVVLILDTQQYRYQKFISDLAGQDIHAHDGMPENAIKHVANWLRAQTGKTVIPGGKKIADDFAEFRLLYPDMLSALELHDSDVSFSDLTAVMAQFIEAL
jgi:hypothetical protein